MESSRTRRDFLRTSAAALLGASAAPLLPGRVEAMEPLKRSGPPRLMLALAAYSFRDFFKHTNSKKQPAPGAKQIDMRDFITYCAEHGCAAEVTSYFFPPVTSEYLLDLKRHAFVSGVPISGTAVGNVFTLKPGPERDKQIADVKQWLDHASVVGAPHIRIFAGNAPEGVAKEEAKKLAIAAIEECCDYAGKKGVMLGLENHGGIVAEAADLLDIVKTVRSPWFGINLDSGNFHSEDPYADLAACAPYTVNAQIKVEIRRKGQKANEPTDIKKVVKILRDANYQGFVALEYEAAPNPWTAVPVFLEEIRAAIA